MSPQGRIRNFLISLFAIGWIAIFHYESVRGYFLEPYVGHRLFQVKFLFPPMGWIMFFNVDDRFAHAQVYGLIDGKPSPIDPHDIIFTRFIGFDNIHRGILGEILSQGSQKRFCRYINWKYPEYDSFVVSVVDYPSIVQSPHIRRERLVYQCE